KLTPAFSSALVIELWNVRQGPSKVKFFLKNGHDALFVPTGPGDSYSTLPLIKQMASEYAIDEPME
ncbi:hypothetical protein PENTCL1PPCAC_3583, partial [Pristionchus entomophagus]